MLTKTYSYKYIYELKKVRDITKRFRDISYGMMRRSSRFLREKKRAHILLLWSRLPCFLYDINPPAHHASIVKENGVFTLYSHSTNYR